MEHCFCVLSLSAADCCYLMSLFMRGSLCVVCCCLLCLVIVVVRFVLQLFSWFDVGGLVC